MIAALFAAAWYIALIVLMVGAAVLGRPRRESASGDATETYELGRWRERNEHARRVREEELAEMRRRAAHNS